MVGQTGRFVALFATIQDANEDRGYGKVLLAFSPLLTETTLTAKSHHDVITWVFETLYNKSMNCVTALIGDNCETNKAIANLNIPMIGCYSHKFNLAVKLATKNRSNFYQKSI